MKSILFLYEVVSRSIFLVMGFIFSFSVTYSSIPSMCVIFNLFIFRYLYVTQRGGIGYGYVQHAFQFRSVQNISAAVKVHKRQAVLD